MSFRSLRAWLVRAVFAAACPSLLHAEPLPREHLSLDRDWKFHLGDDWPDALHLDKAGTSNGPAAASFVDTTWRTIQVPHDWAIELPFDPAADRNHGYKAIGPRYPENSVAWYRRTFALPAADEGRRIWLTFDGVYRDATVWINGWLVKRHESGYAHPSFDATPFLHPGDNVIAAGVNNGYASGGLDPHVTLERVSRTPPAPWTRSLFNGLAQIIVQSTREPGEIHLTASADGVSAATTVVHTQPSAPRASLP